MATLTGHGWRAVQVSDVSSVNWRGTGLRWHPLRHALQTTIIGVGAYSADAGDEVIEDHVETTDGRGQTEIYLVLAGSARFTLDGAALDAGAGTFVAVEPPVRRHAVATADRTVVVAFGGPSDYVPAASEWIERARPLIDSDPPAAGEILGELRDLRPESPGARFGEALLAAAQGDRESAAASLAAAVALAPALEAVAADEPLLAPLLPLPGSAATAQHPTVAPALRDAGLRSVESRIVITEATDSGGGHEPPCYIAPLHVHHEDDEAWYVLEGTLRFELDGRVVDVPAGGAALAARGVAHTWWNPHPEPARYVLVMTPRIESLIVALHALEVRSDEALERVFREHRSTYLGWPAE